MSGDTPADVGASLRAPITGQGWREQAACTDHLDLFYAPGHRENEHERIMREAAAINTCRTCPVITQCRDWYIANPDKFPIAGGMTPQQRTRARRQRTA